jgi:hypothetical protein
MICQSFCLDRSRSTYVASMIRTGFPLLVVAYISPNDAAVATRAQSNKNLANWYTIFQQTDLDIRRDLNHFLYGVAVAPGSSRQPWHPFHLPGMI